jgi:hypothetical protein
VKTLRLSPRLPSSRQLLVSLQFQLTDITNDCQLNPVARSRVHCSSSDEATSRAATVVPDTSQTLIGEPQIPRSPTKKLKPLHEVDHEVDSDASMTKIDVTGQTSLTRLEDDDEAVMTDTGAEDDKKTKDEAGEGVDWSAGKESSE